MIIDCHTHVWRYPDHIARSVYEEQAAVAERTGHGMNPELNVNLEDHWRAMGVVDRAVVFGLRAAATGYQVPNDYVADYVRSHSNKLIAFAAIDPNESDPVGEIQRCVFELDMRGLKMSPVYSHFDPLAMEMHAIYSQANELKLPIVWHQAGTLLSQGSLENANPVLLDRIARDFPDLTMVLAHMGKPWYRETALLVRKHPRVFADISSVLYHPWEFYQTLLMFHEWGVTSKLVLGSDFPWMTPERQIQALYGVNEIADRSRLPKIPDDEIRAIVENNAMTALRDVFTR